MELGAAIQTSKTLFLVEGTIECSTMRTCYATGEPVVHEGRAWEVVSRRQATELCVEFRIVLRERIGECPNSHWGHNMSAGRCLNCNVSAASPVRAQNPVLLNLSGYRIPVSSCAHGWNLNGIDGPCPACAREVERAACGYMATAPNPYPVISKADWERSQKPTRRFDTPGRKWMKWQDEVQRDDPVHGNDHGEVVGPADAADGWGVNVVRDYVHPRSLKGRVNVAALGVDDPCGDDVA